MYHNFRQLWLVSGVKLMEINSNLFSRKMVCKVFLVVVSTILLFSPLFGEDFQFD